MSKNEISDWIEQVLAFILDRGSSKWEIESASNGVSVVQYAQTAAVVLGRRLA